jgi:hypothetical protein
MLQRLLQAGREERARRARIRRRLAELEERSIRREAWRAHADPFSEHDTRTCEYCLPVPRQIGKAF